MRCCKPSIAFVAFARVPEDATAAFRGELETDCVPLPFCADFPEEALDGFFLFNEFMAILFLSGQSCLCFATYQARRSRPHATSAGHQP